jgi:hypothetical protein
MPSLTVRLLLAMAITVVVVIPASAQIILGHLGEGLPISSGLATGGCERSDG